MGQDRHPGQQCRRRHRRPDRGFPRSRVRLDHQPQRQIDVLHLPVCRQAHDRPEVRRYRQHGLAGRGHRAARRSDLLPLQGGGVAHDQVLCRRMGQAQCAGQLRRPHFHQDRRHGRCALQPGVQGRCDRAHRRPAPHRRAQGSLGRGGVPRLRCRVADHRADALERRRRPRRVPGAPPPPRPPRPPRARRPRGPTQFCHSRQPRCLPHRMGPRGLASD